MAGGSRVADAMGSTHPAGRRRPPNAVPTQRCFDADDRRAYRPRAIQCARGSRLVNSFNPAVAGCNSDKADYCNTPDTPTSQLHGMVKSGSHLKNRFCGKTKISESYDRQRALMFDTIAFSATKASLVLVAGAV